MKHAIFLLISISFLSCQKKEEKLSFSDSTLKDINEIVQTIIMEDSLMVLKNHNHSRMFCDSLIKLDIYIPEKKIKETDVPPPPPSFHSISINRLLNSKISENPFFTTKDSLFLIHQNEGIEKLLIAKTLAEKINTTNKSQEFNKKQIHESYNFYEMTIPVFSLDKKRSYVQLNHYCGMLCGSGRSICLEKKNGKWTIIQQWRTWIS